MVKLTGIKIKQDVCEEFRRLSNMAGLTHSETLKELLKIYKEFIILD